MASKNDSPQDDIDLFRQAMAGTNRSHQRYRDQRYLPQESVPRPPIKIREMQLTEPAPSSGVLIDETDQGDTILFSRSGLQRKIFRKLKRGEYVVNAILDLHGRTTTQSEHDLTKFIADSVSDGFFTLLIIHGKGLHSDKSRSGESGSGESGGVLKQYTVNWLKQQSRVMAFCSALPRDGGTGALYVLLRVR